MDNLTPLDARNSLLLDRPPTLSVSAVSTQRTHLRTPSDSSEKYLGYAVSYDGGPPEVSGGRRPLTPLTPLTPLGDQSGVGLMRGAAPMGMDGREPTVPNVGRFTGEFQGAYGGGDGGGYGRAYY